MRCLGKLLAVLALVPACSGTADPPPGADASQPDGPPQPPDLNAAGWALHNVSNTPGTISHDGVVDFLADGQPLVVFAEPAETGMTGPQQIYTSRQQGSNWTITQETTADGQHYFPDISVRGDSVAIAYSAPSADGSDIAFAQLSGSSFGAGINLTGALHGLGFTENRGQVLFTASGTAVMYLVAEVDIMIPQPARVVLTRFTDPANPGVPEDVIPNGDCSDLVAKVDPSDVIHAIAKCNFGSGSELVYVTDRSGGFQVQTIPLGASTSVYTPDLAVGADGSVHIVWAGSTECAVSSCRDIFYSVDLATPVPVTGAAEELALLPTVAVDGFGRAIVAFSRNGGGQDVFWTFTEDGVTFVRAREVTPATPDTRESEPESMIIDPSTGLPVMTFMANQPRGPNDPVDTDIIFATLTL